MKRYLVTFALGGILAAHASAILNFNLPVNTLTTTPGTSVTFTGTVTGVPTGADLTVAASSVGTAFMSTGGTGLTGAFTTNFLAFLNSSPQVTSYSGDIFTVAVPAGTVPGMYDTASGLTSGVAAVVGGTNAANDSISDNELFAVQVNPVPEPATMAALGLGAVAMLRRRRKA